VSSATVDAEELQRFFNLKEKGSNGDTAVALSVSGRSYAVEVFYSAIPVPDYVQEAVNTVIKIHENEEDGDVLVFLTGQDEVDRAVTLLNQHALDYTGKRNKCKFNHTMKLDIIKILILCICYLAFETLLMTVLLLCSCLLKQELRFLIFLILITNFCM